MHWVRLLHLTGEKHRDGNTFSDNSSCVGLLKQTVKGIECINVETSTRDKCFPLMWNIQIPQEVNRFSKENSAPLLPSCKAIYSVSKEVRATATVFHLTFLISVPFCYMCGLREVVCALRYSICLSEDLG